MLVEVKRDGEAVVADRVRLGGAFVGGHQAQHRERHGDERQHDRKASRDPREVERDPRPAGYHEVAEDACRQIGRARRGPERRGDDETELGHRIAQAGEDARAPRRTVARRVEGVEGQPQAEDEDGKAQREQEHGDHEAPALAQLELLRRDEVPGRDPRTGPRNRTASGPPTSTGEATRRFRGRARDGRNGATRTGHACSPNRLVTDKNQSSSDVCTSCRR